MRNQTSFRLTTTLLPWDMEADTTTVINKLDENWEKFKPTFSEETVVLTNDDRTIMETTRAYCDNWHLTFVKRGLSDDASAHTWDNRKLTWNPWSLAFVTAGAGDWIDKDDDIIWTGDQTYTGDLTSTGSATYRWLLTTEKWVQYPSFENLAALEAYQNPFAWMFAVLESDWELYRYNAVTQQRDIVTTSTPAAPEKATTSTIWTVRVATDTEFNNWTATGSQWESLMATVTQIKNNTPVVSNSLHYTAVGLESVVPAWQSGSLSFTVPHDWFISIWYTQIYEPVSSGALNRKTFISTSWTSTAYQINGMRFTDASVWWNYEFWYSLIFVVTAWTFTVTLENDSSTEAARLDMDHFFYFW